MDETCLNPFCFSGFALQSANMELVSRMYLALVLFALLKETNLWIVAEKFQLSRGFIQTLLSSSSAFCSCVLHFTEVSPQVGSAVKLRQLVKPHLKIVETDELNCFLSTIRS